MIVTQVKGSATVDRERKLARRCPHSLFAEPSLCPNDQSRSEKYTRVPLVGNLGITRNSRRAGMAFSDIRHHCLESASRPLLHGRGDNNFRSIIDLFPGQTLRIARSVEHWQSVANAILLFSHPRQRGVD